MKRYFLAILVLVAFWGYGCASQGMDKGENVTDGNPGGYTAAILREFKDKDGNKYTCSQASPDEKCAYNCIKEGTQEAYSCVLPKDHCDQADTFDWCVLKEKQYKPPCTDPLVPNDHKSGRQCWNPPQDYCKDGWNTALTWYCSKDGTHCCRAGGGDCFLCGWIEWETPDGKDCKEMGTSKALSKNDCQALWQKVPASIKECMSGQSNDPQCAKKLNENDRMCRLYFDDLATFKGICPATE